MAPERPKTEMEKILRLLNKSFTKGAWHGPTVQEIIAQVDEADAFKRLPNTHSIIELVAHMTVWRLYVVSRMVGDLTFTVVDETNFSKPSDWAKAKAELEESHSKLIAALEKFPEGKLSDLVPAASHKYTFYTMFHGIIHHDLYHAGQIMLIKKAASMPN